MGSGQHLSTKPALVNGELALLLTQNENQLLTTVMVLETDPTGIARIYSVRNPEKLAHLQ